MGLMNMVVGSATFVVESVLSIRGTVVVLMESVV